VTKYVIKIEADDHEQAAQHAILCAKMIDMGMTIGNGFNPEGGVLWDLEVTPPEYEHGDYRDEAGNLIHVSRDNVVHVTWANAEAKTEDIDVPVAEWIEQHGEITSASE
jgi:hypothetical protein